MLQMTALVSPTLLLPLWPCGSPRFSSRRTYSATLNAPFPSSIAVYAVNDSSEFTTSLTGSVKDATSLPAADVVRAFYSGINRRDLLSVEGLIAEDCVYEDLVYPQAFVGRKRVMEFFEKFVCSISADLQFVIDDISAEDSAAVGVAWHLEWKQKAFPFSKGCSFYRLQIVDGSRKIIYARDSVESALKPGNSALAVIRGVTWLLNRIPMLAEWL